MVIVYLRGSRRRPPLHPHHLTSPLGPYPLTPPVFPMALPIFIDYLARRFTLGAANKGDAARLIFRQGETVAVQLYFMDSTGGTLSSPFPAYWAPAGMTIKLGICEGAPTGVTDVLLAFQDTWTPITNGWSGSLNCNTTEIANALAAASSVACTIEIEVTESGGSPVKLVQDACTITAAVIDDGSTTPAPVSEYPTRNEALATFVRFINTAGSSIILVSPDGTKAVELKCGNDGSLIPAVIDPWVA